jgi:putative ABC transport system permease protein
VKDDPTPESQSPPIHSTRSATPDYFRTLGIPLVAGRTFRDSDNADAPNVALINRNLARKRWAHEDPIGKYISVNGGQTWCQIVGIVGDVKDFGLGSDTPYQIYVPMAQAPAPAAVLVRTATDPKAAEGLVRRAIREAEPRIAVTKVQTMEEYRADSVAPPRTLARLFALFAALALVIAVAGIGSMLALWVRQRIHEIGIRIALGAGPGDIVGIVLRQGMALVLIGLVAGFGGAIALTRLLSKLLFHVTPTDAVTYAAVTTVFTAAALLACYVPARRAAGVDPQTALRAY